MERNEAGFTLMEVMIAMVILAIALVTVFQSQSQSISMATRSRFLTVSSLLAQGKAAEIDAIDSKIITSGSGDFGDDFPDYAWSIDVKDTEFDSLKKIDVVVINTKMAANNSYQLVLYKY
jgi:general secretion pathway protein I